jgi:hypothetical protein
MRLESSRPPGEGRLGYVSDVKSIRGAHSLRGIGDWDAEKGTLRGESAPEDDESSEPGMACGSKRGTDDEVCSGLSSSLMRASRRATVSRRSCVRVFPLPSSYSQRSCFLARTHCWQEGFAPSQRCGGEMNERDKKEQTNYHFSLPAKGIRCVVPEEERGRQTCTEDMLCLFGEWGRSDGLGLPNSPRSL